MIPPLKIHLEANVLPHIFISTPRASLSFPAQEHHFLFPGDINICIKSGNSRIAINHILLYDNDLG